MKRLASLAIFILSVAAAFAQVPVRLLEINVQQGGVGTDGKLDVARTAKAIYNNNALHPDTYVGDDEYPDIVSAVEVMGISNGPNLNNGSSGSTAKQLASQLSTLTGKTWKYFEVNKYWKYACGGTLISTNEGVAILSPWPLTNVSYEFMKGYECSTTMPILKATVTITKSVNGIPTTRAVNFFATHWDWLYEAGRELQAVDTLTFMQNYASPKILQGDFNANETDKSIQILLGGMCGTSACEKQVDTFDTAFNMSTDGGSDCHGMACGYYTSAEHNLPTLSSGFPYIHTRKSRLDKIFTSKGSTSVVVKDAFVPDSCEPNTESLVTEKIGTSDDDGVRHSDHNMMFADIDLM